jgi:hypothetical protein
MTNRSDIGIPIWRTSDDIHPALVPMFQTCLKYQLPSGYHRDFIYHDVRFLLEHDPTTPFLWLLRENGTHIFDELPLYEDLSSLFSYEKRIWGIWDGSTFMISEDLTSARTKFEEAAKLVKRRKRVHDYTDADHPEPCKYGHTHCATINCGPCMDEMLTTHEADDPSCPLCKEAR